MLYTSNLNHASTYWLNAKENFQRIVKTVAPKAEPIAPHISEVAAKRGKIPTLSLRAPTHQNTHPPSLPPQPRVLLLLFVLVVSSYKNLFLHQILISCNIDLGVPPSLPP